MYYHKQKFYWYSLSDSKQIPSILTPWSFIHFYTGILSYIYLLYFKLNDKYNFIVCQIIHLIYEINDLNIYFSNQKNVNIYDWTNNSIINSLGDTLCFLFGWLISYKILKVIKHK